MLGVIIALYNFLRADVVHVCVCSVCLCSMHVYSTNAIGSSLVHSPMLHAEYRTVHCKPYCLSLVKTKDKVIELSSLVYRQCCYAGALNMLCVKHCTMLNVSTIALVIHFPCRVEEDSEIKPHPDFFFKAP